MPLVWLSRLSAGTPQWRTLGNEGRIVAWTALACHSVGAYAYGRRVYSELNDDGLEDPSNGASSCPPQSDGPLDESPAVETYDSRYLEEAFDAVPEAGKGHRWYDRPFRLLRWCITGRRRRLVPPSIRSAANYLLTLLMRYNDHQRDLAWSREDPMRSYSVREDEHVSVPALWIVELFPPSRFHALREASDRSRWSKRRGPGQTEPNETILKESRSGRGWTWWRLAEIADTKSGLWFPDGSKEELPTGFKAVELRAVSVGSGLTAVIAKFTIDPSWANRLNAAWHAELRPALVWRRKQLQALDPLWSGLREVQRVRQSLHDSARSWMQEKAPGFYSATNEPQVLLDLMLFREIDVSIDERTTRDDRYALRALGITEFGSEEIKSAHLPGLQLVPVDERMCHDMKGRNTWTLFGCRGKVEAGLGDLSIYSNDSDRAIAHAVDDRIRMFVLGLGLSGYVASATAQHAALRDSATSGHRYFRSRQLRKLRLALLNLSLDLAGMQRDTAAFWTRDTPFDPIIKFSVSLAPNLVRWEAERGMPPTPPIDFNEHLRKKQEREIAALVQADSDYRDILSTASSLGASIASIRVGRVAVGIALASLAVSVVTLRATDAASPAGAHPTPTPSSSTPPVLATPTLRPLAPGATPSKGPLASPAPTRP